MVCICVRYFLFGLWLTFCFLSHDINAQQYHYKSQTKGGPAFDVYVKKYQHEQRNILELTENDRYSKHTFDAKLGTKQWRLRDAPEHHDFTAIREGNYIHIQGIFKNEPVDKKVEIDQGPWYNKLDHGLSKFAISDQQKTDFWVLKLLSDLDATQMHAEKVGEESIKVGGESYPAVKVKLTLHGFLLSKMWSAYCWYRATDGLFLRYEGANGGPGTPTTIIELEEAVIEK